MKLGKKRQESSKIISPGVIIKAIIIKAGANWTQVDSVLMGQVFFENEKLSTAIRANKKGFTLTQQADLNLPDITSSSVMMKIAFIIARKEIM